MHDIGNESKFCTGIKTAIRTKAFAKGEMNVNQNIN